SDVPYPMTLDKWANYQHEHQTFGHVDQGFHILFDTGTGAHQPRPIDESVDPPLVVDLPKHKRVRGVRGEPGESPERAELSSADEWWGRIRRARRAGEPLPESRGSSTEHRSVSEQALAAVGWLHGYYRSAWGRSSRPQPGDDVGDASIAEISRWAGG